MWERLIIALKNFWNVKRKEKRERKEKIGLISSFQKHDVVWHYVNELNFTSL